MNRYKRTPQDFPDTGLVNCYERFKVDNCSYSTNYNDYEKYIAMPQELAKKRANNVGAISVINAYMQSHMFISFRRPEVLQITAKIGVRLDIYPLKPTYTADRSYLTRKRKSNQ